MSGVGKPTAATVHPAPLLVGEHNAEAVIGRPWAWVRRTARALGVPLYRRRVVDAEQFREALEAEALASRPGLATAGLRGPERVLAAIGRRMVGGGTP
jgi:hypothetical protein